MAQSTSSIRHIRRRLLLILLRSFFIVVLLTLLLTLVATAFQLGSATNRNPFFRSPIATILESYYLGHGSWDGVQAVLEENTSQSVRSLRPDWQQMILLDTSGKVILVHGQALSSRVGSIYIPKPDDMRIDLAANGQVIGTLYVEHSVVPHPWQLIFPLMGSIGLISIFLGILTLVIGLLLIRRIVNPLAEVMAAAQAVASGDLSVRVPVRGRNDDLHALSDNFNEMAEALERNDRERRGLFADVAHELRTPLTVLRGRLEGVLDGVYPATEEYIAPALEETYLLERLVEDLRLLALAETRQLHFEMKDLSVREVVERVQGMFTAQAAEKQISLSLQANPGLPMVHVDPQRLEQVVSNLVDNALRYSPQQSAVEITVRHVKDGVEVAVSDHGPGVAEDELPLIFNRFWRSDKSRTRSTGGAGLGLAIAKQLIEAQDGKIYAENLNGMGLRVRFVLPGIEEK
jgi:signal transduction histidine kinase